MRLPWLHCPAFFREDIAMGAFDKIRSGISGLDEALDYIRLGDNVVWQISDLEEFRTFAEPFARQAVADGRNVIYIRFAQHKPVLRDISGIRVSNLDRPGVTMLTSVEQKHKFSQRNIDLLDCGGNRLTELPLDALLPQLPFWYKKWCWNGITRRKPGWRRSADTGREENSQHRPF